MLSKPIATDQELFRRLEAASKHRMTPAERREQRISFVYGQLMDCAPHVTKEQIRQWIEEREGKLCPEPPEKDAV